MQGHGQYTNNLCSFLLILKASEKQRIVLGCLSEKDHFTTRTYGFFKGRQGSKSVMKKERFK